MKLGFIDYYLDEWHANHYPTLLRELSGGEIEVAYAYAETDAPNGLTTDAWCQKNNVQRVNSIAELVALADGIIVLAPDNTERHEELCRLPLQSGKRVYVDKTFAPDAATAARLFRLAQAHGTPCYSTSALRYAAEYQDIDPNTVRAVSSWGPYDFETESVHQLEPILTMIHAAPPARDDAHLPRLVHPDHRICRRAHGDDIRLCGKLEFLHAAGTFGRRAHHTGAGGLFLRLSAGACAVFPHG